MKKGDKKEPRYVAKYNPKLDVFEVEDTKTGKTISTYAKTTDVTSTELTLLYLFPPFLMLMFILINMFLIFLKGGEKWIEN